MMMFLFRSLYLDSVLVCLSSRVLDQWLSGSSLGFLLLLAKLLQFLRRLCMLIFQLETCSRKGCRFGWKTIFSNSKEFLKKIN